MWSTSTPQALDKVIKIGNVHLEFSTFLVDLPSIGMMHETKRMLADQQLDKQSGFIMLDTRSKMTSIELQGS